MIHFTDCAFVKFEFFLHFDDGFDLCDKDLTYI